MTQDVPLLPAYSELSLEKAAGAEDVMGEIRKYISITKERDLFHHRSSRSQIALFKQQNNTREMDRNPIALLLTKVLKETCCALILHEAV